MVFCFSLPIRGEMVNKKGLNDTTDEPTTLQLNKEKERKEEEKEKKEGIKQRIK